MIIDKDIPDEIKLLISSSLKREINEKDALRLQQWLNESEEHVRFFNSIHTSWILAGLSKTSKKNNEGLAWEKIESKIHSDESVNHSMVKRRNTLMRFVRNAAIWILFFSLGGVISWWFTAKTPNMEGITTEIVAPLGAKSMVKMPDGSVVWLNAGSKLSYKGDFNGKDRHVFLTGEGFFSVSTNKNKPFIVHAADVLVRAFGTKFNVKAYPEEKTVTAILQEGKIDVLFPHKSSNKKSIALKPNEKVVYYLEKNIGTATKVKKSKTSPTTNEISPTVDLEKGVDVDLYTSWKGDRWVIESIPLETLAPMLERRFNKKLYFKSEELKTYKFTGTIENETVEQIMLALQMTAPLDYKIGKDSIVLSLNPSLMDRFKHIITSKR